MIPRILTILLLLQESHAFSSNVLHRTKHGQGNQIRWATQGLYAEPADKGHNESSVSEPRGNIATLANTSTSSPASAAYLDAKASEITQTSNNNGTNNLSEDILSKEKRVLVTISYTSLHGLRPYYLTILKKIKESNPDVIVERIVLPYAQDDVFEDTVFEVMVDGKVVIGKSHSKYMTVRRSGNDDVANNKVFGMSVYVSMEDVNVAIGKARKKRRPSTTYTPEDREKALRLEMLKGDDDF